VVWGSLPAVGAGAVVVRAYGSPEVLGFESVDLSEVAADELRIRVLAAAVNHSDLEIRAGRWPIRRDPPFPYVPGLEAVGEVVATGAAVESVAVGATVVTMMQGLAASGQNATGAMPSTSRSLPTLSLPCLPRPIRLPWPRSVWQP